MNVSAAMEQKALADRVVDQANLLSEAEEARLAAKLAALQNEVGPQLVVATVPTLDGHPIEEVSIDLARTWGLGDKDRNDGVMLLVAPTERKVRIEVGIGLERRVTDPYAARVIRERALPSFKNGRFAEGIEAATDALISRLRSKASDEQIRSEDGVLT